VCVVTQTVEAGDTSGVVNLFFVSTPLQYFICHRIASILESDAHNRVYGISVDYLLSKTPLDIWNFMDNIMPPPRGKIMARWRYFLSDMRRIADQLPADMSSLRMHIGHIHNIRYNYLINYLQRRFPRVDFRVRIIPAGVEYLTRGPLGFADRFFGQHMRKLRVLYSKDLNYYCAGGNDITGVDAPVVDRFYWFEGVPCPYEKIFPLPLGRESNVEWRARFALCLGAANHERDISALRWTVEAAKKFPATVLYKPHPSDKNPVTLPVGCEFARIEGSLEEHFMRHHYPLVTGITSTGLLTARIICGTRTRIVSVGLNRSLTGRGKRKKEARDAFCNAYRKFGIIMIDA